MKSLNIIKSRLFTHSPLVLTHNTTSLCNCKCKTCDLWKKSPYHKNDLTKEEVFKMLDDAKQAGMIGYVAWGGEPLMRKDLPELLRHAKQNGLATTIITNGYYLEDRSEEIAPYTDCIIVSIDAADELHDEMRGVHGIREKALKGIEKCKGLKIRVMINSVISSLNIDKVDGLIMLSKELDVPIAFEPLNVYPGYNEHLKPDDATIKDVFLKIIEYKSSGHRIVNSKQYLEMIRENYSERKQYTCHAPKVFIEVHPEGEIACCLNLSKPWGNSKDISLKELFYSSDYKEFCKDVEKCNKCVVSCVIESSLAYSMEPVFLLDKVKNLL
ncbi:hypothetical protein CUJ83_11560 [Methanocella sp. CWC-04]|uniref:Radical SAM core domain-containing protein n=1 Tax=Methanooceanicella nereidis TaxID=2052831 RepID=A0AAP2W7V7_9EURY|nr:radical SAM protein [Methanocella sp. CWC-04]MCD1295634.1 hypothetical protein [Methanocella sp. CWC-04]